MDAPGPPPAKVGKYEVVRRLGVGGMAEVFEAKAPGAAGFTKTVVVKKMLPHLVHQPYYTNMFVREAKIAAAVNHRNVVQVFELDQLESGEYFMVMEFVRGPDLRQMLARSAHVKRRLPPWFAAYVIAEILDGLDYAYNAVDEHGSPRKMIHRDVTPSNIFVSVLGEVKLGDFGVARDDTFQSETRAGQHKGKVAYMAPEMLLGRGVDGRVDVFSAGVVLWECLTQSRLFGGKPDLEIMNNIVNAPRRAPSSLKPDIAKEFDVITLDAIEPDVDKRMPSAKVFRARLLEALHKKHGSVLAEDVRAVVEVLQGKRPAEDVLEPSGSAPTGSSGFVGDSSSSGNPDGTPAPRAPADLPRKPQAPLIDDLLMPPPSRTPSAIVAPMVVPQRAPHVAASPSPAPVVHAGVKVVAGSPDPNARPLTRSGSVVRGTGDTPPPERPPIESTPSASNMAARPTLEVSRPPSALRASGEFARPPVAPRVSSEISRPPMLRAPELMSPATVDLEPRAFDDMEALIKAAIASVSPEARNKSENFIPQDSLIAGLDVRRHAATLSDAAMQRWASFGIDQLYEGAYPHYLRDSDGEVFGPLAIEQAHQIFKVESYARMSGKASISGDNERWVTMTRYAEITGQTMYVRAHDENRPAQSTAYGNLRDRSLPALFAALWKLKASGIVTMIFEGYRRLDVRELELSEGRPCAAYANAEPLQLPGLLRAKKLVPDGLLVELMWKTILVDRPLLDVASAQLARNLESYRGGLEKEKLTDLAAWDSGQIFFDPTFRTTQRPFASSLISILPVIIGKGVDMAKLKQRLGTRADGALRTTASFQADLEELGLAEQQHELIEQIVKGKRVSQLLKMYAGVDKTLLPLVYVLLEIGALTVA